MTQQAERDVVVAARHATYRQVTRSPFGED